MFFLFFEWHGWWVRYGCGEEDRGPEQHSAKEGLRHRGAGRTSWIRQLVKSVQMIDLFEYNIHIKSIIQIVIDLFIYFFNTDVWPCLKAAFQKPMANLQDCGELPVEWRDRDAKSRPRCNGFFSARLWTGCGPQRCDMNWHVIDDKRDLFSMDSRYECGICPLRLMWRQKSARCSTLTI